MISITYQYKEGYELKLSIMVQINIQLSLFWHRFAEVDMSHDAHSVLRKLSYIL